MQLLDNSKVLLVVLLLAVPLFAQQARLRTIEYAPNRTIADRIMPDDEVVIVHRPYDYGITVPEPDATEVLQGLLDGGYGTALIVDVAQVSGILVDESRWIRTLFHATVTEVLRRSPDTAANRVLVKGARVAFSTDGGELRFGKILVKTSDTISFPKKERYLVFLGPRFDDSDHRAVGTDPLIVRGNRLLAVSGSKTKLADLTLEKVRQIVTPRR